MKRFLICLLALMVLCGCALAQDEPRRLFLGGSGDDSSGLPLALEDGSLILPICSAGGRGGESVYPHKARKVWLVRLSPEGKLMWEASFGEDEGYTTLADLYITKEGELAATIEHSVNQVTKYIQPARFSLLDGSITWQGERTDDEATLYPRDENALRLLLHRYRLQSGRVLEEEIHDSDATCEPRLLRLLDENGGELWTVNAKDIGLEHVAQQLDVPGGTLLCGSEWNEESKQGYPTALLISDEGQPVWYFQVDDLPGELHSAVLDAQGRVLLVGWSNEYSRREDGSLGERIRRNQLLFCLAPKTGELLWRKENDLTQSELPNRSNAAVTDFGYLLCSGNGQYTGTIYQAIDRNGENLAIWETKVPETTVIGPRLVQWNGECWTEAIAEGLEVGMDVMLEKVDFPVECFAGQKGY